MTPRDLVLDVDALDVASIEFPEDRSVESLATGHGNSEIGASCGEVWWGSALI
jgi:hypothetical protein